MIEKKSNGMGPEKIDQAFELLNEAAQEKRQQLYDGVNRLFSELEGMIDDSADEFKRKILKMISSVEEALGGDTLDFQEISRQTFQEVEKAYRQHPWKTLGGIAVGAYLLGTASAKMKSRQGHNRKKG